MEQWRDVMGVLDGLSSLTTLNTRCNFRNILGAQGGLRALNARCQAVGPLDLAAALAHYLPRSSSTLTKLDIRW